MCSCKRHGDQYATCTCGCLHPAPTAPTPDDAARAEAERLYPQPVDVETGEPMDDWGYAECERKAYLRGRADERARIAARRDEASDAVQRARAATYPDEPTSTAIVNAVLAALGVSDR